MTKKSTYSQKASEYVKRQREKHGYQKKYAERYKKLRSFGFSSAESNQLKFKSAENIDEQCKDRTKYNYQYLVDSGVPPIVAASNRKATDKSIEQIIKQYGN